MINLQKKKIRINCTTNEKTPKTITHKYYPFDNNNARVFDFMKFLRDFCPYSWETRKKDYNMIGSKENIQERKWLGPT